VRVESPDRRVALVLVDVKRRLDPKDVAGVVSRLEAYRRDVADAATPVVVAPYLGERTVEEDGLCYVAPSQAAIDLLTSPGRGPEEAEALIEWMQANERQWREQP